MRILYYSRDFGSTTTTFIREAMAGVSQQHQCLYLCQRAFSHQDNFEVVPYPASLISRMRDRLWREFGNFHFQYFHAPYSAAVRRVVETFAPDIIHCHFAAEALMLLDNIDFKKYPVVIHFHGYDASLMLRYKHYRERLRHLFTLPNIFPLSCNQFFAQRLANDVGEPRNGVTVVNYGINENIFSPSESTNAKSEKLFLQVSSLTAKKGHAFTLKAFALFVQRYPHVRAQLVIAGAGPLLAPLKKMVVRMGLGKLVDFPGALTPQEVRTWMSRADVFVHPSATTSRGDMEGMPNVIIEAMAMELPVVATLHSGIPELVEDNVNGYLLPERNVSMLATRMHDALAMGRLSVNRKRVLDQFTSAHHTALLLEFYDRIGRSMLL